LLGQRLRGEEVAYRTGRQRTLLPCQSHCRVLSLKILLKRR
jgi:hypothetical protein